VVSFFKLLWLFRSVKRILLAWRIHDYIVAVRMRMASLAGISIFLPLASFLIGRNVLVGSAFDLENIKFARRSPSVAESLLELDHSVELASLDGTVLTEVVFVVWRLTSPALARTLLPFTSL